MQQRLNFLTNPRFGNFKGGLKQDGTSTKRFNDIASRVDEMPSNGGIHSVSMLAHDVGFSLSPKQVNDSYIRLFCVHPN